MHKRETPRKPPNRRQDAARGLQNIDGFQNVEALSYDEQFLKNIVMWISFWRKFPFHFCKYYLGINLKPFQCVLLYQMMHNSTFCFIAARGLGKTWVSAVYCVVRCILYPNTKIVVAAGTRSQASEIFGKINDLYKDSVMLRQEIYYKSDSKQFPTIEFKNGSSIIAVTANDNSRGNRCNLLLLDEFRLIDKDTVDQVLRKFEANPRHPKYLDLPEYYHLAEENITMYLTSAWLKSHWSYDRYRSIMSQMLSGKSYFCCNLPYQISVKNGLRKKSQIIDEMTESDFDQVKWKIEMEGHFLGEAENSLFDTESLNSCRRIEKAVYPLDVRNKAIKDEKRTYSKKTKDEIRLVFADIALMASNSKYKNDASCFGIMRLTPNSSKNDFLRDVIYIETWTGQNTETTALRIRELFDDFECDYLIMDGRGIGLPVFDLLVGNPLVNKKTGAEYYPLACMNNDELNERCLFPNNPRVIYTVIGTAELNSQMAIGLQSVINSRKIRFLYHENDGQEYLSRFNGYDEYTAETIGKLKSPYIQTSLAIYEMLSLESERKDNGIVRVKEQSGKRKDRYSAIAMGNYFATELSRKTFKVEVGMDDDDDYFYFYE